MSMEHGRGWLGHTGARVRLLSGRFIGLAVILLLMALVMPFVSDVILRRVFGDLTFSALLVFSVLAVERRLRVPTLLLAVPPFVLRWVRHVGVDVVTQSMVFSADLVFLGFLTAVLLDAVFRDEAVTTDTIVGAICVYVLFGVTCGYAFALMEALAPGAFLFSPPLVPPADAGPATDNAPGLLVYYSVVNLTTVGSNQISPISAPARALAAFESLLGQMYLTVLLARLVGIATSREPRR